jgi:hypothetical protein
MKVSVKTLLIWIGIFAALAGFFKNNIAAAIVSAGAFIAFAIIESREMKILNEPDKED